MFRQLARVVPNARFAAAVRLNGAQVLSIRAFSATAATPAQPETYRQKRLRDPCYMPTEADRSDYWSIGTQAAVLRARQRKLEMEGKVPTYPYGYVNGDKNIDIAPDGNDGSLTHIIKTYGANPFVGLTVIAILSKELLCFDEEFAMALLWSSWVVLAWVNLAKPLRSFLEGILEQRNKVISTSFEALILGAEIHQQKMQWYSDLVPVMEQHQADYKKMLELSYKAKNIEVKNAFTNATLTKLQQIATTESLAREKANTQLLEKVFSSVWAEFAPGKLDAKARDALLTNAINNVGSVTKPTDEIIAASFAKHGKAAKK